MARWACASQQAIPARVRELSKTIAIIVNDGQSVFLIWTMKLNVKVKSEVTREVTRGANVKQQVEQQVNSQAGGHRCTNAKM